MRSSSNVRSLEFGCPYCFESLTVTVGAGVRERRGAISAAQHANGPTPRYLDSLAAAIYVGYTAEQYKDPRVAFMKWVNRNGIPKCHAGRKARFLVRDLDRALQLTRQESQK